MDTIGLETLTAILTRYFATDIPTTSHELLLHLKDKKWQMDLMNQYTNICLVSKYLDNVMCFYVSLPFQVIPIRFDEKTKTTKLYTRFHRVICMKPIPMYSHRQANMLFKHRRSARFCLDFNNVTKHIVWNSSLVDFPDVMKRINRGSISIIGFRDFNHSLSEFKKEEQERSKDESTEWHSKYLVQDKDLYAFFRDLYNNDSEMPDSLKKSVYTEMEKWTPDNGYRPDLIRYMYPSVLVSKLDLSMKTKIQH